MTCLCGFIVSFDLVFGLLVAVAYHTVEEAVWSTFGVFVAFLLVVLYFFVDVLDGFLVGGGVRVVKVDCGNISIPYEVEIRVKSGTGVCVSVIAERNV